MQEGLLWFDKDPNRTLSDKIKRAVDYYQHKFGHTPNACYLNAADADTQSGEISGIQMRTAPNVLRYHLWLGIEPH